MQTGAKDPVDPAMFEPRISLAGEVPAFQLLLAGKLVERADEVVIAMVQRARHVLAQDEQHPHITVAHEQIAAFDELNAHLLGEEHMLEIGAVVAAWREQHDDGSVVVVARRHGPQILQ